MVRRHFLRALAALWLPSGLTGCSLIPSVGPSRSRIGEPGTSAEDLTRLYFVVDIDERSLPLIGRARQQTLSGLFGDNRRAVAQVIGVGDAVQVTIWEAASGGLFSAPSSSTLDRAGTGARAVTIPEQQVGQDGFIMVPYTGREDPGRPAPRPRISVVGLTPSAVEERIERALVGRANDAQVLVTVTRNISNTVTVLGEVTSGGRVPLTPRGDRLLDVIAVAGGIRTAPHETFLRLSRDGRTVSVPIQALIQTPNENILARPGDVITLVRQPQTFVAAGATGRNSIVPFEAIGISLLEAVGSAGGLVDSRTDPGGLYVMRREPIALAQALGAPEVPVAEDQTIRVVYRLDMREPAAFFRGREFQMRDKDVLYAASAPLNELQKILQIFNLAIQPALTGAAVTTVVGR